ncbi:MAG: phenylalanine--tRNA ligase subunit alpha [Candidatus Nanoarchaeia archaeon]|nr:phenylalanine--tRNA ligase subunit alpha [Candidatus Nanoarchaeia archaeon]MDD5239117.1 phenylalanine--tRNA ligase subunit alpha [Candidatus Nanoarchaeia archaeon]
MNSVVESLHDLEKKVLLVLKDFGKVTSDIIAEKAGINADAANKAIELLKEKQLIDVDEIEKELFKTTQLGLKYTEKGLPEYIFLKTAETPVAIADLKKKAGLDDNEFNVSLGLCKRNNLIEIAAGKISITNNGKAYIKHLERQKDLLNELRESKYADEVSNELDEFLILLKQRNLVEVSIEKIKHVSVTDAGKKVLPQIKFEKKIDELTPQIIKSGDWKQTPFRKYDLNVQAPEILAGKQQPYMKFINEVRQKMISLGFEEMTGPYVELAFFNNEILYMPQDHPAREIQDVFHLKTPSHGNLSNHAGLLENVKKVHEDGGDTGSTGWNYKFEPKKAAELLLRSQTTAASARTMAKPDLKIPGKYFSYDKVFRVDTIDWKHLIEFNQFEGIVLDSKITFRELLGLLKLAAEEIAGVKKFKYVPGYFPFTEPSVELHAYKEGKGWIELGGAGMFRPEVLEPLGIDVPVIAWGLGIDRLFMLKNNIMDIRQLFSSDLKWLREFKW